MKIDGYDFGRLTVSGNTYTSDVIISPEGVNDSWWREKGHEVSCKDLEPVWTASPELLVIGTGAYGVMKVLPDACAEARRRCAQVHVLPTKEACKKYNELAAESGRRVVAALHLTC